MAEKADDESWDWLNLLGKTGGGAGGILGGAAIGARIVTAFELGDSLANPGITIVAAVICGYVGWYAGDWVTNYKGSS